MTTQIVELLDAVKELRIRLSEAEVKVRDSDIKITYMQTSRDQRDEGGGREKQLVDKRFWEVPKYTKGDIFKEWSDEFVDYVDSRDFEDEADLLRQARDEKKPIMSLGHNPTQVKMGKALYRVLKQVVLHPEARALITYVENKNVWEAFRQLHARFDPRNDAAANSVVQRILDYKNWKCRSAQDIPVQLARWESLQREFKARTGIDVLTLPVKKEIMMKFIPEEMSKQINLQTLMLDQDDITYDKIRGFVTAYATQVQPHAPMPMDCNALEDSPQPHKDEAHDGDGKSGSDEPMDSFGQYPKGGGVGKGGAGKGGKRDDKGKNNKDDTCNICSRKGHWARECWFKEEIDPKTGKRKGDSGKGGSKGGKQKGGKARPRSVDGKFYRKTVNGFEEYDGEDDAEADKEDDGKEQFKSLEESEIANGMCGGLFEDEGWSELKVFEEIVCGVCEEEVIDFSYDNWVAKIGEFYNDDDFEADGEFEINMNEEINVGRDIGRDIQFEEGDDDEDADWEEMNIVNALMTAGPAKRTPQQRTKDLPITPAEAPAVAKPSSAPRSITESSSSSDNADPLQAADPWSRTPDVKDEKGSFSDQFSSFRKSPSRMTPDEFADLYRKKAESTEVLRDGAGLGPRSAMQAPVRPTSWGPVAHESDSSSDDSQLPHPEFSLEEIKIIPT